MSSLLSCRSRKRYSALYHSSAPMFSAGGRPNWLRQSAPLMKLMKFVVFVAVCGALMGLLSACGSGGAVSECSWVEPIYVGEMDTLSEETAQQILAHNESWAAICQ